ncbi:hypothetical protein CDIK_3160 [Cucumispora dikerogammari]|nr:hypothetical protein CDIK_3160 [Cucumispora dikerogammari]
MVMGFKNSPIIMQKVMNKIFDDLRGNGVLFYLDDILIYAKNRTEHIKLVDKVIRRLGENNFKIGEKKIQYCQNQIELLGIHIDGESQSPLGKHKEKLEKCEILKTVKELQSLLEIAEWF